MTDRETLDWIAEQYTPATVRSESIPMANDAPERIFIAGEPSECGHYYPSAVEAEGEHGGIAFEYTRTDLAVTVKPMEWQPIETAPKDGTVILVLRDRKGFENVYPARWAYGLDSEYPWQILCEEHGDNALLDDGYITHWAHLPPAPDEDLTPDDATAALQAREDAVWNEAIEALKGKITQLTRYNPEGSHGDEALLAAFQEADALKREVK